MFLQLSFNLIMILLAVAFFSLFERKLLSIIQSRKGPDKVVIMGIMQPISDAIKLVSKNIMSPNLSHKMMYSISPLMFIIISLMSWLLIPMKWSVNSIQSSLLALLLCLSLSVYGLITLGWFSNSKYSMLGSIRSVAQSISYEVVLSFTIMCIMISSSSLSIHSVMSIQFLVWLLFPHLITSVINMISSLAESNRTPFDLSESESELVSGFCTEYGGMSYTYIFLSENASLLFMMSIFIMLFTGMTFVMIKVGLMVYLAVWIRSTFPRIRFDKMISLCWLEMLPIVMMMTTMSIVMH
uniref:NADH dehydrogenase subunit 1 n=1 Tax=Docophoroides brevis TaxID=160119 RepID=UPI00211E7918|nr:NADH dehydrogenase subunit 1 [Docophoroides brevis]UTT72588.1 NADH dehydrogenase subunit 1 [Docophoroides brevis]